MIGDDEHQRQPGGDGQWQEASVPFDYSQLDEQDADLLTAYRRGQAEGRVEGATGMVEYLASSRTSDAARIRLECLKLVSAGENYGETTGELARRLGCSRRRIQQVVGKLRFLMRNN